MSFQRAITGWGDTGKLRLGFSIGERGFFSWPSPTPDDMHFGDDPSGFSGDPIDSWLAPVAAKALTSSGGNRPVLSSINSLAAALFDGVDDYLQRSSSPASSSSGEVWLVVRPASVSGYVCLWAGYGTLGVPAVFPLLNLFIAPAPPAPANGSLFLYFSPGPTSAFTRGFFSATTLSAGSTYLIRVTGDGSDWRLFLNGEEDTPYTYYGTGTSADNTGEWFDQVGSKLRLGRDYLDASPLSGRIGFFMHVPGLLSDEGAAAWTRLLMGAYGIS